MALHAAPAPEIKKREKKPKKAKPAAKAAKEKVSKAKPTKKAKKDPNAPKRGLSAFMFFSSDNRDKVKKEHAGCSFGEVGKYLGEAWSKADKKTKDKYEAKAVADKARYEKEKAAYEKKKK